MLRDLVKKVKYVAAPIGGAVVLILSGCGKDKTPTLQDEINAQVQDTTKTVELEKRPNPHASEFKNGIYTVQKGDCIESIVGKYVSFLTGNECYLQKGTPRFRLFYDICTFVEEDIIYRFTPNVNNPLIVTYVNPENRNTDPNVIQPGDEIDFNVVNKLLDNEN